VDDSRLKVKKQGAGDVVIVIGLVEEHILSIVDCSKWMLF
jgi:hypothetical protein